MKLNVGITLFAVALLAPRMAAADSILFTATGTGADGVTLNASALFDVSGNTLTITLSNLGDTSGSGPDVRGNTLTGLFFDLPDVFTLTPLSATIAAGSLRQASFCDVGPCDSTTTNVGGEFGYATGIFSDFANRGIASAGYLGGSANFNGPNLDDPDSLDGINFGIIAPVTPSNPFNPNGGMAEPLIESGPQGAVQFTMQVSGGTLTAADFAKVHFQYGTDFTQPNIPEPTVGVLTVIGIVVAARRVQKRRRH
ncbi:MAG: hypothetical protein HY655_05750 [Acidobacteria bacterium]|nr:hypothetical protein [Acidobacteriota bacterium]